MAGIYIHIPFCRSKCAYCDFFSLPATAALKKDADCFTKYLEAVKRELALRIDELSGPVSTIYIGGGTPTAIPLCQLAPFLSWIYREVVSRNQKFDGEAVTEFTVEANPEDISFDLIDSLRQSGVDRISIGIQSFDTAQLDAIMRHHDSDASFRALSILRESGINYSADLIYGLPQQSLESWSSQIKSLLDFEPPHFSAYLLSYEPGTRLYARKEQGKVTEADEHTACRMYGILTEAARERGYNHYEISNFSLPGKEARHNSSYWNLTPYLGLGCSAHSFDGDTRRINPANLGSYINSLLASDPTPPYTEEAETLINKVNDYIITSLRTSAGLSLLRIRKKWGSDIASRVLSNITRIYKEGGITSKGDSSFRIPEQLWLTSDAILREVILDAD